MEVTETLLQQQVIPALFLKKKTTKITPYSYLKNIYIIPLPWSQKIITFTCLLNGQHSSLLCCSFQECQEFSAVTFQCPLEFYFVVRYIMVIKHVQYTVELFLLFRVSFFYSLVIMSAGVFLRSAIMPVINADSFRSRLI